MTPYLNFCMHYLIHCADQKGHSLVLIFSYTHNSLYHSGGVLQITGCQKSNKKQGLSQEYTVYKINNLRGGVLRLYDPAVCIFRKVSNI